MTPLEATRAEVIRPDDFIEFWHRTLTELALTPVEWERIEEAGEYPGYHIDWVRFASIQGQMIYGWLAVPQETRQGESGGYLWLPGYSLGTPPPGPESLYPATLTLGLNLHGNLPDTPYVHPGQQGLDYLTRGITSPDTYLFRDIVCHCLRALVVLAQQPEVNPGKIMVGGMSQGGGLALMTAALAPETVRLCFADMPSLGALDLALSLIDRSKYPRGRRIPDGRALIQDYALEHPELAAAVYRTYRYFDPLSHAGEIMCPTQFSAGGRDPSCRPPTIYAVYNEVTAEKEMLYLPNVGHEIVPEMHAYHQNWVNHRL